VRAQRRLTSTAARPDRVPAVERFGRADLLRTTTIATSLAAGVARAAARSAAHRDPKRSAAATVSEGLVDAFEDLGPTFVKLGQLIASSPGLFPEPLAQASRRCLDRVTPASSEAVRRLVEQDLGAPVSVLFAEFDDEPLSAASIAQVHGCVLRDGRHAVLKVQRPDIAARMNSDLRVLYQLARLAARSQRLAPANPRGVIADLHRVTNEELRFTLEATRQDLFRSNLAAFGDNDTVAVPEVYWEHCSPRVICMERMYGVPIDQLDPARSDVNGFELLRHGVKAWLEAACVHGPFHGDLHAGNIWVLDDGRAGLLDFGIMGELTPEWRSALIDLLRTIMVDHHYDRVAAVFKNLGVMPADAGTDTEIGDRLAMILEPMLSASMSTIALGEVLQLAMVTLQQFGARVPVELVLIGKQLLYIERYITHLAPDWALLQDPWLLQNILATDPVDLSADQHPETAAE
jgi:predicted unusual protein kinase regulating ubiquinone biosynthesis (AarF/ABC1/UbiB family)